VCWRQEPRAVTTGVVPPPKSLGWLGAAAGASPVRRHARSVSVARVVVDVMLKPEILDPQGKAVHGALGRLGFDGVASVRQGKRFEIELDGDATPEAVSEIERAAGTLLSNPVIEDYALRIEP
jgi:phosphoribosylformylglycinamidine synthase subunit PurS